MSVVKTTSGETSRSDEGLSGRVGEALPEALTVRDGLGS